jgi:hypothetical protein
VVLDTPIGKDAIRDILKKRNLDLIWMITGAYPKKKMQRL